MPLRVVTLTSFAISPAEVGGGVEAVARTLAFALAARGDVELHIVCSRQDVKQPRVEHAAERLFVHFLPRLGRFELASLFLHDRWQIGRLLRQLRPDVIHTHELGRYGFVCQSLGYPYVLTVHGIGSVEQHILTPNGARARTRGAVLRFVERATWRGAARIVANSTYVRSLVPPDIQQRVVLIPNPVDPLFFAFDATPIRTGRIAWVGRMSRLKGVDVLLRALPTVRAAVPAAHVRLIGPCGEDTAYAQQLRELAAQAGPPGSIHFVGERHGAELRSEYASAAVVAQPSRQDNVPMAIAEAMVVGRPVIAARVGGIPDLVAEAVTGALFEPEDDAELAQKLMALLADEPQRASLGTAARTIARVRFDAAAIAAQHVALYADLSQMLRSSWPTPVAAGRG